MKRTLNEIFIDDLRICANKRVLVRLDWNVSLTEEGEVEEATRITRTFPLLEQLSLLGATTIIVSHFGEKGESLAPIASFVKEKLPFTQFIPGTSFEEIEEVLKKAQAGDTYILENIRMFEGELENDPAFAKKLAGLGNVYINDAFSVAHRKQASVVSVPEHILSYAGPLFKEEVSHLLPLLTPELPTLFIIGGAKITTKLSLIQSYLNRGAHVFVGGAMVHNILKQIGYEIGGSLYDTNTIVPNEVINHPHLLLPVDVMTDDGNTYPIGKIPKDATIIDCGEETLDLLSKNIESAKTIIMNGPVGLYEEGWRIGTETILKEISKNRQARTIIGGGDTLAVINTTKEKLHFSFISLAGGAMLTYLTDQTLVGIEALQSDTSLD